MPERLERNQWALSGNWTLGPGKSVVNEADGRFAFRFHARDVNLVMSPPASGPVAYRALVDGEPPGKAHGLDTDEQGNGTLDRPRLHQLIREPRSITDRTVEITFLAPGRRDLLHHVRLAPHDLATTLTGMPVRYCVAGSGGRVLNLADAEGEHDVPDAADDRDRGHPGHEENRAATVVARRPEADQKLDDATDQLQPPDLDLTASRDRDDDVEVPAKIRKKLNTAASAANVLPGWMNATMPVTMKTTASKPLSTRHQPSAMNITPNSSTPAMIAMTPNRIEMAETEL